MVVHPKRELLADAELERVRYSFSSVASAAARFAVHDTPQRFVFIRVATADETATIVSGLGGPWRPTERHCQHSWRETHTDTPIGSSRRGVVAM